MSDYSIDLKERTVAIEVKEILSTKKVGSAGQPNMTILDTEGKKHTLSAIDFPSFDWDKIKVGAKIEIIIRESISEARVL